MLNLHDPEFKFINKAYIVIYNTEQYAYLLFAIYDIEMGNLIETSSPPSI
jgi:hypothetical protein